MRKLNFEQHREEPAAQSGGLGWFLLLGALLVAAILFSGAV